MAPHLAVPVTEPTQVGEARRTALRLALEHGFDDLTSGRVALVVTELGTNLARHAKEGRLLLAAGTSPDGPVFEVLSVDAGPGMAEPQRCLQDGYSTGGTPGTGLGAVQRVADGFSMFSLPGAGTVIAAHLRPPSGAARLVARASFQVGAVRLCAPGETACGDNWAFRPEGSAVAAVIVADGLGHGPQAAHAADAAMAAFADAAPGTSPSHVIDLAHAALRGTRGATVAMARLDADAATIDFAGAGNVIGRLVSGLEDRTLLSQHGTVGLQIRHLQDVRQPWPEHAVLVLHSDGLVSRWRLDGAGGLLQCHPVVLAAWLVRDHCRGRDDTTVVVVARRGRP